MTKPRTFSMRKVDTVLWCAHFPQCDQTTLRSMRPGQVLRIYINGQLTRWERMRDGAGRPTYGLKIIQGREIWEKIPMRDSFVVSTSCPDGELRQTQAPTQAPLPAGGRGVPSLPLRYRRREAEESNLEPASFELHKRDGVIWVKHLPVRYQAALRALRAGRQIHLYINGVYTIWRRMKDGVHPTEGFKIVFRREVFGRIPMQSVFRASFGRPR